MTTNRIGIMLAAATAAMTIAGATARAEVTVFQTGVAPTAEYAGCADMYISDEQWEKRGYPANPTMVIGGKRHVLIKFDLSALPKDAKINKAVLRLADAGYPAKGKDGKLASPLKAYALKRGWDYTAWWPESKRNPTPKEPGEAWTTPGGDYDTETDFGQGAGGLVAAGALFDGVFGHTHELDVTEAVRRWQDPGAPGLPNHGLLLRSEDRGTVSFASSDWPVAAYRPKLIVDHGAKATGIEPLKALAGGEVPLDEIAQTADGGSAKGEYAVVCVGQGPNCHLRGASNDAYVKEDPGYDGPWGWMPELRIAGAVDRGLMYFDLSKLPKDASIKQARLVTTFCGRAALARQYRYGAFLLKLPESPGWKWDEVTALGTAAGKSWPAGGVLACSSGNPVALGKLWQKEVEDKGRKTKIDAGFEFDLTGVVRAWVGGKVPNCGIVLDNRIEGGQYDIYSAKSWIPDNRPYLEITVSPGVEAKPEPIVVDKSFPFLGDYWVEAMKEVHKKFKGTPGTLAQYGDSITITGAFLAEYGYSKKIEPKNATPEVLAECKVVEKYADLSLWQKWKGRGNTGMMASDWMRRNIVAWQKVMDPEAAVIQFGTNDGFTPPEFAENTAYSMRKIMATGAVPMLTVPPPKSGQNKEPYRLECISIARALKIPLIDYQGEVLRRRPDDWDGQLPQWKEYKDYQCPTLMFDAHPSNPSPWINDWSEEGLNKNGYTLRNYMTIRTYYQVISKVFLEGKPAPEVAK